MTNASHATPLERVREQARDTLDGPAPARPATPTPASMVCPYCGHKERADAEQCSSCRGFFEPLSKIATQNAMGPWQIRDDASPFRPGCSIETLRALIWRGKLTRESVIRGPSTKQFWRRAAETRGVAHLLGMCHACAAPASADQHHCRSCGASFLVESGRDHLGLDPVRPLPVAAAPAAETPPARAQAQERAPSTPESARAGFLDVFASPSPASVGPSLNTQRALERRRRTGSRAVRQAVAAATVAICAAALSVAVWAASVAGPSPANAAPAPTLAPEPTPVPDAPPESVAAVSEVETAPSAGETTGDAAGIDWSGRIQDALTLAEQGDIDSLKEAVSALREVQRSAPEGVLPPDLGDQVEGLERRLDDLTVARFLERARPGR